MVGLDCRSARCKKKLNGVFMLFQLSIAFHIIGLALWLGSYAVFSLLLKRAASGKEGMFSTAEARQSLSRSSAIFFGTASALVLVSGLFQIVYRGPSFYFSQGWFHAKLTLVIGLFLLTFLLYRQIALFCRSGTASSGTVMMLHQLGLALFIAIVFLTELSIQ